MPRADEYQAGPRRSVTRSTPQQDPSAARPGSVAAAPSSAAAVAPRLRVAIIGDRGIPARYGGFSTLVEEVSLRLVAGHDMDVTVYCRSNYYAERPATLGGVRLIYLPTVRSKHLESPLHSAVSILHAITQRFDALLVLDPGNAPLLLPLWLLRKPTAIHTDGLGWQRRKWGALASAYYRLSETLSCWLSTALVTDARAMQDYYLNSYGAQSAYIPYGSQVGAPADDSFLARYGLQSQGYFVVVTRIEPDNNTDIIVREYRAAAPERPLVIVGGARFPGPFSRALEAQADEKVRFLGSVYDSGVLNGLYAHALAYLHGHQVGGTNPSLLRAMQAGVACVAIDVVFNREVLSEGGLFFDRDAGSLARILQDLERDPAAAAARGEQLRSRAESLFRWDAVAAAYADLFRSLAARRAVGQPYHPEAFVEQAGRDRWK